MFKKRLNYTAEHWASAAVSSSLVEKMFDCLIDHVVVMRNDEEWGACVVVPNSQDTIPCRVREQNTCLLPVKICPISRCITKKLLKMFHGMGVSHRSSSPSSLKSSNQSSIINQR